MQCIATSICRNLNQDCPLIMKDIIINLICYYFISLIFINNNFKFTSSKIDYKNFKGIFNYTCI